MKEKSDTPETDALHENRTNRQPHTHYFEMVDLARRLERERNKLKKLLKDANRGAERSTVAMGLALKRNAQTERELHETRLDLDKALAEIDYLESRKESGVHSCHDRCARRECVLKRERDEARQCAQQWRDCWCYEMKNPIKDHPLPWEQK